MTQEFGIQASSMQALGLDRAKDKAIFERARLAGAVILTKDDDYVELVRQRGPPPSILGLTVGNTATARVSGALRRELAASSAQPDEGGSVDRAEDARVASLACDHAGRTGSTTTGAAC